MKFKEILKFAIGPMGSAVLGLAIVPLSTWIFTPEDIGRFNLYQLTISLFLLLFMLGLDSAYVREYHGSKNLPGLLKSCFIPGFIVMTVGLGFGTYYSTDIVKLIFNIEENIIFLFLVSAICLNYISRFISLILRMQERGIAYSMCEIAPRLFQLMGLLLVFCLEIQRSFLTLLIITSVSVVITMFIFAYITRKSWLPALTGELKIDLHLSLFKYGAPLMITGLMYWCLTATSSIILRSESNFEELGVYSVTSSFAAVAAIFQSIFSVVWAPIVYKWIHKGEDLNKIDEIAKIALVLIGIIFSLVGSMSWIISYILPSHYYNVNYLVVCAIAPILLYALSDITSVGINISRRTNLTIWITLVALVINILLSYLLIPLHGALGAIVSNSISFFILFVGRSEISNNVWHKFPRFKMYIAISIFTALSIATAFVGVFMSISFGFFWLFIFLVTAYIGRSQLYLAYTLASPVKGQID